MSSSATVPLHATLLHLLSSIIFPLESIQVFLLPAPSKAKLRSSKTTIPTQKEEAASSALPTPQPLFTALAALAETDAPLLMTLVPLLLDSFTSLLALHRHTLFPVPQSSSSPSEVYTAERISGESRRFFEHLRQLYVLDPSSKSCLVDQWRCTRRLWAIVEEREATGRGYDERDPDWKKVGSQSLREAVDSLATDGLVVAERDEILSTITVLLRLDYGLVEPFLPSVLAFIATVSFCVQEASQAQT